MSCTLGSWLVRLGPGWRATVLFLVVGSFASPAAGQDAGSIIGQLTDESGGLLPGVAVTATSPALQVPQVTDVTNERGEYRLSPLPIGTYSVVYALSGFQTVRREDLRLTVGFVAKVDIVMKVGAIAESLIVSAASPVVDVRSTATGRTEFTRETLEVSPTGRNGLIALLAQAPGVRTNVDVGGDTVNASPIFKAFGQDGETWQTLEGVSTASHNGNQASGYYDYSMLEEVRIQTAGNNAEVPVRGVMLNAVMKSGSNDFHGDLWWSQTNASLQSDNVDDALKAQGITSGNRVVGRRDLSADMGGRLVRDKLWFYASTRQRTDTSQVLDAYKPDGSPATDWNLQGFAGTKESYQMSKANRLVGFVEWNRKHPIAGQTANVAYESRQDQLLGQWVGKVEWQNVHGNSLVTSLQFGKWFWSQLYRDDKGIRTDDPNLADHPSTTDLTTLKVTGQAIAAGNHPRERKYHSKGSLTWYRPDLFFGSHEIRTGFDYITHMLGRYWYNKTNGNYQLVFNNGVPFELNTWNYPVAPNNSVNNLGVYGMDSWTLGRRVVLNLGLRYAHDNGFIPEQCRVAGQFAAAQCFDRVQFKIWNTVAPRLHAAWDVRGDGKTVLKGGWGRFDKIRYITPELTTANFNNMTTTLWLWHDLNGNKEYDPGEVNLNPNGPDYVSISGTNNAIPNPNEKEPKLDEFSLALERELGPDIGIRITGVYTRTFNVYQLNNNLRPYEAYNIPITRPDPGPDGRVGSADDPGTFVTYYDYATSLRGLAFEQGMLINSPEATKTFRGFELAAARRMAGGWQFSTSYSATKRSFPFPVNPGGVSMHNPNAEYLVADKTWEWLAKISGAYTWPGAVLMSTNFEIRSGEPYARTVLFTGGQSIPSIVLPVEPLGTRRYPNLALLDLRVEKTIRIAANQRLAVRFNVYNALNSNEVTAVTTRSGAQFLRPTSIVPPRIAEVSASYSF